MPHIRSLGNRHIPIPSKRHCSNRARFPPPRDTDTIRVLAQLGIGTGSGDYNRPVHLTHAGDNSERLFVVEKQGLIRIIQNGQVLQTPFLDIRNRVDITSCGECGLLSLAFPPDHSTTGDFFVYYTSAKNLVDPDAKGEPNGEKDTVVARYRLGDSPNIANGESEEVILSVNQPYENHNGGQLAFGPDGNLYVGLGDGGDGGDPLNAGQRTDTLLGKILRIGVGGSGYTIPVDNPFAQSPHVRKEIWALGLRNPWRFAFDRGTGDLYIGDVGQNDYEEINFQPANAIGGRNYGWKVMEGTHCYKSSTCKKDGLTLPVAEYSHKEGCSVTGGMVYRGPFPALRGVYLYGDYCSGNIWGLRQSNGGWQTALLLDTNLWISSFGEDEVGHVYVLDYNGKIYRVLDPDRTDSSFIYLPDVRHSAFEGTP